MNLTDYQEVWQIDVGGQIYEAKFDAVAQWIFEGSLLPQDMVKRGNLRWIEARKVPVLLNFFNAKEQGLPPPIFGSTTEGETPAETPTTQSQNIGSPPNFSPNPYQTTINQTPGNNFEPSVNQNYNTNDKWQEPYSTRQTKSFDQTPATDICSMHPDVPAKYVCETCANRFCGACPSSYGGTVKICPFCGAMCKPISVVKQKAQVSFQYQNDISKGFGFEDFFNALAYPFKFKTSLFVGAIMFMFFTLGQSAASMGSIFLVGAALISWMMSNMMTFGILANTVDNFSQGKIGENFMPGFDDFNLWDDVVHPFFLSIAVYIVSFGLLAVVIIGGIWYTIKSITSQVGSYDQTNQTKVLTDRDTPFKNNPAFQDQKDLSGVEEMPDENRINKSKSNSAYNEDEEFKRLNDMIQEQRKKQLESGLGQTPETKQQEIQTMIQNFLKMAIPFLIIGFIAFLWGIFYFPAACCVAGYTRSFWATLNPSVGLETIKLLGSDYVKLWLMGLTIVIVSVIVGFILGIIFIQFNMPTFGNLPAKAIGALFGFYFSVVFSVLLGFVLYKNSNKLKLFKA